MDQSRAARLFATCLAALLASAGPLHAEAERAGHDATARADPYAPYAFLIGDWFARGGDGTVIRQSFAWGPGRGYLQYATYTRSPGGAEHLHFAGIAVWNARSRALDYVFAVEPGSGAQEAGTMTAQPDGTIVREVTLTAADGKRGQFRQVIRPTGPASAVAAMMRRTPDGWAPTFPGSDRLEMTRAAAAP